MCFRTIFCFLAKLKETISEKMSFSGCILRTLVGRMEKKTSLGTVVAVILQSETGYLNIGGGKTTVNLFTHDLTPDNKKI